MDEYVKDEMKENIDACNVCFEQLMKNKKNIDKCQNIFVEYKQNFENLKIMAREQGKLYPNIEGIFAGFKEKYNNLVKLFKRNNMNIIDNNQSDIIFDHIDQYKTEQINTVTLKVQDGIIGSLENSLKMIDESKQIGIETIAQLSRQEEQLLRINEETHGLKSELNHAFKQTRIIARNIWKDCFVRLLLFLVLASGIAAIIVVIVLKK